MSTKTLLVLALSLSNAFVWAEDRAAVIWIHGDDRGTGTQVFAADSTSAELFLQGPAFKIPAAALSTVEFGRLADKQSSLQAFESELRKALGKLTKAPSPSLTVYLVSHGGNQGITTREKGCSYYFPYTQIVDTIFTDLEDFRSNHGRTVTLNLISGACRAEYIEFAVKKRIQGGDCPYQDMTGKRFCHPVNVLTASQHIEAAWADNEGSFFLRHLRQHQARMADPHSGNPRIESAPWIVGEYKVDETDKSAAGFWSSYRDPGPFFMEAVKKAKDDDFYRLMRSWENGRRCVHVEDLFSEFKRRKVENEKIWLAGALASAFLDCAPADRKLFFDRRDEIERLAQTPESFQSESFLRILAGMGSQASDFWVRQAKQGKTLGMLLSWLQKTPDLSTGIRNKILSEIEKPMAKATGRDLVPFARVYVHLGGKDPEQVERFKQAFGEAASMGSVLQTLQPPVDDLVADLRKRLAKDPVHAVDDASELGPLAAGLADEVVRYIDDARFKSRPYLPAKFFAEAKVLPEAAVLPLLQSYRHQFLMQPKQLDADVHPFNAHTYQRGLYIRALGFADMGKLDDDLKKSLIRFLEDRSKSETFEDVQYALGLTWFRLDPSKAVEAFRQSLLVRGFVDLSLEEFLNCPLSTEDLSRILCELLLRGTTHSERRSLAIVLGDRRRRSDADAQAIRTELEKLPERVRGDLKAIAPELF